MTRMRHWYVNKMTAGFTADYYHNHVTRHSFCGHFSWTCSEHMTTPKCNESEKKWKKVKKSDILSKIEQNWAGFSRTPNTYFSIASNFEQNWAKLSKICQTHQYFFVLFWAILSKIEQNWARFAEPSPILFLVLRAVLSKIEQNWARFAEHSPILFLVVRAVLSTIEQVWAGTYDKDVPWFNLLKYWNISILLMIKRNLTHERTHSHKFLQINNHTQTVLHVSICSIFTPIHIPTIWWNWFNWRNWGTWQIWRWWGWWPWWRWWKKTRWWPGPQSMVWCLKFSGGINNSTWQL